jgi:hypothetical protein
MQDRIAHMKQEQRRSEEEQQRRKKEDEQRRRENEKLTAKSEVSSPESPGARATRTNHRTLRRRRHRHRTHRADDVDARAALDGSRHLIAHAPAANADRARATTATSGVVTATESVTSSVVA